MDFLNYWDTRIDANERFFNNYPHIANFAFIECQELWDRMSADYAALLARHNALVEAVAWERECAEFDKWANDNCQGSYEWDNVVYCATLEVDRLIAEESAG